MPGRSTRAWRTALAGTRSASPNSDSIGGMSRNHRLVASSVPGAISTFRSQITSPAVPAAAATMRSTQVGASASSWHSSLIHSARAAATARFQLPARPARCSFAITRTRASVAATRFAIATVSSSEASSHTTISTLRSVCASALLRHAASQRAPRNVGTQIETRGEGTRGVLATAAVGVDARTASGQRDPQLAQLGAQPKQGQPDDRGLVVALDAIEQRDAETLDLVAAGAIERLLGGDVAFGLGSGERSHPEARV